MKHDNRTDAIHSLDEFFDYLLSSSMDFKKQVQMKKPFGGMQSMTRSQWFKVYIEWIREREEVAP